MKLESPFLEYFFTKLLGGVESSKYQSCWRDVASLFLSLKVYLNRKMLGTRIYIIEVQLSLLLHNLKMLNTKLP